MTESQQGTEDWYYRGPADLLLREGKWYNDGRAKKWRYAMPKACFRNAALFAFAHRLPYVEGYATAIIPVHHAWCLDHDGRILEVTWKTLGADYFGVQAQTVVQKWTPYLSCCDNKGKQRMTEDELRDLIERLAKLAEGQSQRIGKLLDIAENHERRLQSLEDRTWKPLQ